jgi:hypothetical protein
MHNIHNYLFKTIYRILNLHFLKRYQVATEQEAGWAAELVWKFWGREKSLAPVRIKPKFLIVQPVAQSSYISKGYKICDCR